jgi:DNA-binding MarR family transcriptional regulator
MAQPISREDNITTIDHLIRDIVWHTQKQASHTLTQPSIALTFPQMVTLLAIQQHGTCRMSELAEQTHQSAGTLTGIVDRLIADGLVERTRSVNDRRVVEVGLTDEGKQRLYQASEARHKDIRRVLDKFGDSDLAQLLALLRRFLDGIQAEGPGGNRNVP